MSSYQSRHEADEVPLGTRCLEHVIGVDAHLVEDDRQFIHERNVDVALGILDDLGSFRNFYRRRFVHTRLDDDLVRL
jgi:hypothetical protein